MEEICNIQFGLNPVYFRELGIGIVAYSPLGRGFFSSGTHLIQNLPEGDIRKVSHAFIRLNNLQQPYKIVLMKRFQLIELKNVESAYFD